MSIKKQRNELTLNEKLEFLNKIDCGAKFITLSVKYIVDKSVTSRIKYKGSEIRKLCFENKNKKKKRQRKTENTKTEEALLLWFKLVRSQDIPVSATVLLRKSCQLATQLGETANLNAF